MSEREDLKFDLLLLARHAADDPGRDLKPKCIILIDQVATYASQRHRHLPEPIAKLLAAATNAAIRADVAGVIENVETALVEIDKPQPPPPPKTPLPTPKAPPKQPLAESTTVVTAKPLKQTTDKLLAALRKKRPHPT